MGPVRFFCGGGMMFFPFMMMFILGGVLVYLIKKHGSLNAAMNAILVNTNKDLSNEKKITHTSATDPLHHLKERYAKGEITKEEFDQVKKDIE